MDSGRRSRIELHAYPAGQNMFHRQPVEVAGKISFERHVKLDNWLEALPRPEPRLHGTGWAGGETGLGKG